MNTYTNEYMNNFYKRREIAETWTVLEHKLH